MNANEESSHVVPDLHIDRKGLTYNRSVSIIRDKEEPVGAHFYTEETPYRVRNDPSQLHSILSNNIRQISYNDTDEEIS
jgi:hypothetical protein